MSTDSPTIDLWECARDLTHTPLPPPAPSDISDREPHRQERRRRTRLVWSGCLALIGAIAATVTTFTLSGGWQAASSVATAMLLVAAGAAFAQVIGVDAFRRASQTAAVVTRVMWWVGVLTSYVFGAAAIAAALIVANPGWFALDDADTVASVGAATFLFTAVATQSAIVCSSAAQPLVSTSCPRLWQQAWALRAWTWSLSATVTGIGLLLLTGAPSASEWSSSFDAAGVICTIGFALIAAVFAWHIRSKERLSRERGSTLPLLDAAAHACAPDSQSAEPALVRLQDVVTRDPFHSESPSALPAVAGFEIVQTVDALVAAVRGAPLPSSWERRAAHRGEVGERFRVAAEVFRDNPGEFVRAGAPFLRRCHNELLTARQMPRAKPHPRAEARERV